jgi:hypothetical protein
MPRPPHLRASRDRQNDNCIALHEQKDGLS